MATNDIIQDEAITDQLLDERTWGWGSATPVSDAPTWFFNTTTQKLLRNTGTAAAPVYVEELTPESGASIWVL